MQGHSSTLEDSQACHEHEAPMYQFVIFQHVVAKCISVRCLFVGFRTLPTPILTKIGLKASCGLWLRADEGCDPGQPRLPHSQRFYRHEEGRLFEFFGGSLSVFEIVKGLDKTRFTQ